MPPSIQEETDVLSAMRESDFKEIRENELPNIPVHMLIGGRFDMHPKFQSKDFDNAALFRTKMAHRMRRWMEVVNSVDKGMLLYSGDAGHFVHRDDPDLFLSSLRILLADYKTLKERD